MTLHETDRDRLAEARLAMYAQTRIGGFLARAPELAKVDYVGIDPDATVRCVAELKIRRCKSTDYATYLLDVPKFDAVRAVAASLRVPGLLIVGYLGDRAVRYADLRNVDPDACEHRWVDRHDRGDPADRQWCLMIPGLVPL